MPLFRWKCEFCKEVTRRLLISRPEELGTCHCGGKLSFVTDVQSTVYETRDNGIMPRKVEQIKDVERLMHERAVDPKDPTIV